MKWLALVVILMADEIHGQLESLCPAILTYEVKANENDRWYGSVKLYTDYTLHGMWLNLVLDKKAELLGNWDAGTYSKDNIDYKIEDSNILVTPTPVKTVKFFVKYNILEEPPKVVSIRLNGREVCDTKDPIPVPPIEEAVTEAPLAPSPLPVTDKTTDEPKINQVVDSLGATRRPDLVSLELSQETLKRILESIAKPESAQQSHGQYLNNNPGHREHTRDQTQAPAPEGNDYQEYQDQQFQCGKVYRGFSDNANPLVVGGQLTSAGQWPWQIALYRTEGHDSNYYCGGTLISNIHVVTAAHCVTYRGSDQPVNKYTLSVYLGKHNLRVSEEGAQVRLVSEILVHNGYDPSVFAKDVAVIKLREAIQFTEWIQPACLWPEDKKDLSYVLRKWGSVVGWGYNDMDALNEELTLVEMPIVDELTCLRSNRKFFSLFDFDYIYCAGERNGSSVCNGDSGGGMVFKSNGRWFLRGLVSLSVPREDKPTACNPNHYIIFTDLAKFLPWIKEIVTKDGYY